MCPDLVEFQEDLLLERLPARPQGWHHFVLPESAGFPGVTWTVGPALVKGITSSSLTDAAWTNDMAAGRGLATPGALMPYGR